MEHLAGPMTSWWKDLGNPELSAELKQKIVNGVLEEASNRSVDELDRERDEVLIGLLGLRGSVEKPVSA
jgi:hypothetical protein